MFEARRPSRLRVSQDDQQGRQRHFGIGQGETLPDVREAPAAEGDRNRALQSSRFTTRAGRRDRATALARRGRLATQLFPARRGPW